MITHKKQCNIADNEADNPDIVNPSDWNDTHDVDVDALNALIGSVLDLGDISGAVNIDLNYSAIKFNLTGNATFTFINPPASGVNRPTTFYGTRTSGSNAAFSFAQSVSWVGSSITPSLLDVQTTVFSVGTLNAGTSYFGFANGLVIETTASGQATTWNPSDAHAVFSTTGIITNDNRTINIYNQSVMNTNAGRTLRAFGGKSAGKWRFAIRVDTANIVNSGSNFSRFLMGIATASLALDAAVGYNASSYALSFSDISTATNSGLVGKVTNSVLTAFTFTMAAGDIFGCNVDINANALDWDKNGVAIAGASFTGILDDVIYFPAFTPGGSALGYGGVYTLLDEISDDYYPAKYAAGYTYWTA